MGRRLRADLSLCRCHDGDGVSSPDSTAQSFDGDDASRFDNKKRSTKSSKTRLSSEQKNDNHKDAENKRRTAIRKNFTELCAIIPGAEGQERSEQVVLTKTSEFVKEATFESRKIIAELERRGIHVPDELRVREDEVGGKYFKQTNHARYEKAKAKKVAKGTAPQDDADGEAEEDI